MKSLFETVKDFVVNDWHSHPWRFVAESWNMLTALSTAVLFAVMAPNIPFHITYPLWLSGTILAIFTCRSRGSSGGVAMAVVMTVIDTLGYIRFLLN
jgi:hypothetical protein